MAGVQVLQPEKKKDALSEGALEIGKDMLASKIKGYASSLGSDVKSAASASSPVDRRQNQLSGGY